VLEAGVGERREQDACESLGRARSHPERRGVDAERPVGDLEHPKQRDERERERRGEPEVGVRLRGRREGGVGRGEVHARAGPARGTAPRPAESR